MNAALDTQLGVVARSAAAAWPSLDLPLETFIAWLRERIAEDDPLAALAALHGADLYLACACLHGDEAAWRELDRAHLARVPQFVARIDASPAFADEITQRLSERLIGSADAPGKLASYTGRGALGAWLRVAAIREAQSVKRRGRRTVDPEDAGLAGGGDDPEVQLLKQRFAREFTEAFTSVLVTLGVDERNVLKLHYLDGLTIEQVGTTYRVSRATAARWIASARAAIIERMQRALGERLGDSAPGAASMLAFVKSQLDISLVRYFESD